MGSAVGSTAVASAFGVVKTVSSDTVLLDNRLSIVDPVCSNTILSGSAERLSGPTPATLVKMMLELAVGTKAGAVLGITGDVFVELVGVMVVAMVVAQVVSKMP